MAVVLASVYIFHSHHSKLFSSLLCICPSSNSLFKLKGNYNFSPFLGKDLAKSLHHSPRGTCCSTFFRCRETGLLHLMTKDIWWACTHNYHASSVLEISGKVGNMIISITHFHYISQKLSVIKYI